MGRHVEQGVALGLLHHPAEIHDHHFVADLSDHGKIVGDEQDRNAEFGLQRHEQLDDPSLDGHIQRRNRLVADEHFRLDHKRAGDADTLTLAAGELVRVAVDLCLRQADAFDHVPHAPVALGPRQLGSEMAQRLGHDLTHGHARVETGQRVLENHLHVAAQ